jgi:hypothetical protein
VLESSSHCQFHDTVIDISPVFLRLKKECTTSPTRCVLEMYRDIEDTQWKKSKYAPHRDYRCHFQDPPVDLAWLLQKEAIMSHLSTLQSGVKKAYEVDWLLQKEIAFFTLTKLVSDLKEAKKTRIRNGQSCDIEDTWAPKPQELELEELELDCVVC